MEKLKKLIESLKEDENKVLCFYGFNDGYKRAERLYICYESNINLYSKLLRYEPLLGKMVKAGEISWEELERALKDNKDNYVKKLNTVRLIHGEYPSCGFDTDHGAQVVGFNSLEELMNDIIDFVHCLLANPASQYFDHHKILTKEQMFKDAIYFGQNRKNWKFLFEWGDNVEERCNLYTSLPLKELKPKDDNYYNLKEQKRLMEQILSLDPNYTEMKEELREVIEKLKEYED